MSRIVKAELAQDLTDLFPPLEPVSLSPTSLSDELIQVFPLLPGTHKFRNLLEEVTPAAANALTVQRPTVPDGFYDYILSCSLGSSAADLVVHNASIAIGSTLTQITIANTAGVGRTLNDSSRQLVVPRSFLLGPGKTIAVFVQEAPTVGANIFLAIEFVRHRILDPHPQI